MALRRAPTLILPTTQESKHEAAGAHVVITIVDADHHTEDWTLMKGDKPVKAHVDLHRVPSTTAASR